MEIQRFYEKSFEEMLEPNQVLVIYGPRQIGKTTLVNKFLEEYKGKVYKSSGENISLREILESNDFSKIINFFGGYDLIFIDEAQQIANIGQALKIIVDQIKGIKVIATGSSSFDLGNKLGEPLVGRQKTIKLFPIAGLELSEQFGNAYLKENLESLLVYGSYPKIISSTGFNTKEEYLTNIRDSYLLKDILEFENLKNSKKILDLLRLVSFQIGNEVSLQELGNNLDLSKNTIEKYLDLLEKNFIVINIRGFSRNLRKEITKTSRYYFYDNGIRNAIIGNFAPINSRDDVGKLWENFILVERLKKQAYYRNLTNNYFWRTWDMQEIDLVEEINGNLSGYEFKWKSKNSKAPTQWEKAYPEASFEEIHNDNFYNFIL